MGVDQASLVGVAVGAMWPWLRDNGRTSWWGHCLNIKSWKSLLDTMALCSTTAAVKRASCRAGGESLGSLQ